VEYDCCFLTDFIGFMLASHAGPAFLRRATHGSPKSSPGIALGGRPGQVAKHLDIVELPFRCVLYRANKPIEFVHFIEKGVGSLVSVMRNGDASEVGTMGNEGIVGLPVVFGDKQAPNSVYMQVPGEGLRIRATQFQEILAENPAILAVMLRYAQAFFNQVAQSAACAHHHSLKQRCCRWLLMTRDRMGSDDFPLTHEFLAMMLGVRRSGVTIAARALREAGLIEYRRGHVTVLDLAGLKKRSCECYEVTKQEFDRLLGVATG
jgi:CRP-like cAMP-binding protein